MSTLDAVVVQPEPKRKKRRRLFTPGVTIASAFILLILIATLFPQLFSSFEPNRNDLSSAMLGPRAEHWFGTDQLGRDLFTRVIHGTRYSLTIGVGATAIAVVMGTLFGLLSGIGGKIIDTIFMRGVDIALAFPELLLALIVIAIIGPGSVNSLFAIGIAGIPSYTRLVRSERLVVRNAEYVEASRALGFKRRTITRRHILPNVLGPVLVLSTISVGTAMIAGASLSFLGLGPAAPTPEWGALLSEGRNFLGTAWWISLFPGLAITLSVISITVVGRRLQARFEGSH